MQCHYKYRCENNFKYYFNTAFVLKLMDTAFDLKDITCYQNVYNCRYMGVIPPQNSFNFQEIRLHYLVCYKNFPQKLIFWKHFILYEGVFQAEGPFNI